MLITVAVCTYNRAELLAQVLPAVLAQSRLPDELLVVDNASTDHTPAVVAQARRLAAIPVRYVQEPSPGIAHARNRALREAQGQYVAFIDDDAMPQSDWLQTLLTTLEQVKPRPDGIAGKVELDWHGSRPNWFPSRFESLLCAYDQGAMGSFLDEEDYLLTTNALFDRRVVLSLDGFRPYLGRKRGQMLGGEDNDMHRRLVQAGFRIYYQPAAVVYHDVPPERRKKPFLVRRLFWSGASQPLQALSSAQLSERPYQASRQTMLDLRRLVRFSLELVNPWARLPWFERWLVWVQRFGRLRTNLLIWFGWI